MPTPASEQLPAVELLGRERRVERRQLRERDDAPRAEQRAPSPPRSRGRERAGSSRRAAVRTRRADTRGERATRARGRRASRARSRRSCRAARRASRARAGRGSPALARHASETRNSRASRRLRPAAADGPADGDARGGRGEHGPEMRGMVLPDAVDALRPDAQQDDDTIAAAGGTAVRASDTSTVPTAVPLAVMFRDTARCSVLAQPDARRIPYRLRREGRPPRRVEARASRRRDRPRRRARDRAEARRAGRARALERQRAGPARCRSRTASRSRSSPPATRTIPDALYVLRHSSAHLLAEAVRRLYPGVKIAIGPPIENGFYYDFEFPEPIHEADLERIEDEIRRELEGGPRVERARRSPPTRRRRGSSRGRAVQGRARRHRRGRDQPLHAGRLHRPLPRPAPPELEADQGAEAHRASPARTGAATRRTSS